MNAPATLEAIRDAEGGELYPRHVLIGCETALVLFAAGFWGRQDAYWVAEAGLRATCVDTDGERLEQMRALYPGGWDFAEADAYAFAEATGQMWDLVSIDCPTNHFERCADLVPLWCEIARQAVVLGTNRQLAREINPPAGWEKTEIRYRSDFAGGVYWATLERS